MLSLRNSLVLWFAASATTLGCSWWLMFEAPRQIIEQAIEIYRLQKVRLVRQGARRLATVLGEFRHRVRDPLLQEASGLTAARTPEEAHRALTRMVRPGDAHRGLSVYVATADDRVLTVEPSPPLGIGQHLCRLSLPPLPGVIGEAHLCSSCRQPLGALSITAWENPETGIRIGIDAHALAWGTLGHLLTLDHSRAWLLDENGKVLVGMTVSGERIEEGPPEPGGSHLVERAQVARSLRGAQGLPDWSVVLTIPFSAVGESVKRRVQTHIFSVGVLLAMVALVLAWMVQRERHIQEERIQHGIRLAHQDKLATLGLLAAGVEHEMRSGLGIALNLLGFAEEDSQSAEVKDHLARIRVALERLKGLSDDLMGYSRIDPAEPVGRTSIRSVVEEALQVLRPKIRGSTRIETRFECDLEVWAPRGVVLQVVVNLLLNALHEIEDVPGGLIRISNTCSPTRARLEVADNGHGLTPELRDEVFKPFFTTKPKGEGTGLGLWICRSLVSRLGGTIHLEEAPEGGALFVVELPYARSEEDSLPPTDPEEAAPE